jgi:hypothetical protein
MEPACGGKGQLLWNENGLGKQAKSKEKVSENPFPD